MNPEEKIVYDLIKAGKITQREISDSAQWLGCHPIHEDEIGLLNKKETTLRKVRQIVRTLRITHNIPILSDTKGYWLTDDKAEMTEYLQRIEATAKSQAAAWFETYKAMKNNFPELGSDYFDTQGKLF